MGSNSFILQALGAVDAEGERIRLMQLFLQEQAARVLQLPPSQLDIREPWHRLGLDSLAAVELKNRLESDLRVALPLSRFLEGCSLGDLARWILETMDGAAASSMPRLAPQGQPEGFFPLSEGQKALWILHQIEPQSAAYNIMGAVSLVTPLDDTVLRRALQTLLDRHPSLGTSFTIHDGVALQRTRPAQLLSFHTLDASGWSPRQLRQRLSDEAHRPFNLQRDPLLRALLFKRGGESASILLLTVHHIVADLWSLQILLQELGRLCSDGAGADLPDVPLHYADYVRWQSEMLSGPQGERLWSFWRQCLAGDLPLLDLPADRSRPPLQTFRGGSLGFRLEADLAKGLQEMGRRRGATLFMTLLAVFQALLHRWTGQTDILTGSPATGRSRVEFSGLVGYLVNPLLLRADLAGSPGFGKFLQQVRQSCLQAFEHQDFPFARLVERLQPQRDPARSPLFQAMFALQQAPRTDQQGIAPLALGQSGPPQRVGGLLLQPVELEQRSAQFDLCLMMAQSDGALLGCLQYNSDLFDRSSMVRLADHFRNLATGAVAQPDQAVSLLPLLSEQQRSQMALQCNDTRSSYPDDCGLFQLFTQCAQSRPDALAISCAEQQLWLSYRALRQRAGRLAGYLRKLGVGPEAVAGLCMDSSLELMIAMLGCVQAGGAYLPLDPVNPPQRLAFMIEDAGAKVLLTRRGFNLPRATGIAEICLDAQWSEISAQGPSTWPHADVHPQSLAYIIYTSGSTGRPKGVAVSQRSVIRLVRNTDYVQLRPSDCLSQASNIAFDVSAFEIWGTFLHAARLALVPSQAKLSPSRLADTLRRSNSNVVNLTPALFKQVVKADPSAFTHVRDLLLAGEALDPAPVRRVLQTGPPERLVNVYGPTENATFSTWHNVEEVRPEASSIPIGRPIANSQAYVVDQWMEPLPVCLSGELVLGGDGLARGYWGRPGLTAERFLPDPLSGRRGARLYRSGDLARWSRDAQIEFLGRLDHQVKVRGFRVELGEIESVLGQHPSVREAVVTVRSGDSGNPRLAAYLVPACQPFPPLSELRSFVKRTLPEYMVPSAFVELQAVPLSPNGKVDRNALPAPSSERPRLEKPLVPPRTAPEAKLAAIWSDLLGLDQVGVEDNFYELGGDSILSIQAVARANQSGLRLTARQAVQYQTIAELAAVAGSDVAVQTEQGTVEGDVALTPSQHWLLEQGLQDPHYWNQSVLLEVQPSLQAVLLERAMQQLLQHHDALRLRFLRHENSWSQFNARFESSAAPFQISLENLEGDCWAEALQRALQQLQASLNLEHGPLIRTAYFNPASDRSALLFITIHHLAVDAFSWRVLLEDLETACRQLTQGQAVQLPPKSTSFQRWSECLQEQARSKPTVAEASSWLEGGEGEPTAIPLDFEGGINEEASAECLQLSLSRSETQALLHQAPRAYRTQINDLLLTALLRSLAGWCGPGRLNIELEGHGRESLPDTDLSRTVGWFTSFFPVSFHLRPDQGQDEAIKAVKERLRAVPRHGIGYGLARYLGEDQETARRLRGLPQPQISFNYLGQFDQILDGFSFFQLASPSVGSLRSPRARRRYLIDVAGRVLQGSLQIEWTFSRNLHRRSTIEGLASDFLSGLRSLIRHCCSAESGGFTPSDFPLARIQQSELDRLYSPDKPLEDLYALAPLQQGLLFHSLYQPDGGEYLVQLHCRLQGSLDRHSLRQAWSQAMMRHPALRTSFLWEGLENPLQAVHPSLDPIWEELDCSRMPEGQQAERLQATLRSDREKGFDPGQPPLTRICLVRLGADSHWMLWSFHHLILDGWSASLILTEVFGIYRSLQSGRSPSLPACRPYSDYLAWHQEQDMGSAEVFWRRSLQGWATATRLPIEASGKGSASLAGFEETATSLSEGATAALTALARKNQLTLSTIVQGAWALLLSRYSGESEVLFGLTVAGRPADLEGVESMAGLFINTLPLRVKAPGAEPLLPWLTKLQEVQQQVRRYEYAPLARIQKWSEIQSGQPLFESIVVFENYPLGSLPEAAGLKVQQIQSVEWTHYPLNLTALTGRRLRLEICWDTGRFDATSAKRMLGHLATLLRGMARYRQGSLASLPLLSSAQRHQILSEWNDTVQRHLPRSCIHDLVACQADRWPDALAIEFEDRFLSYGEANRRADHLAAVLNRQGARPESLVALCLDRCPEALIGMLAILKNGAAFLPLNPGLPSQRLEAILETACAHSLLIGTHSEPPLMNCRLPRILIESALPGSGGKVRRLSGTDALNAAYVIYTSGSTGNPKGVVVSHLALVHLVKNSIQAYGIGPGDRLLQFASLSFDAAVEEIFRGLLSGATLVLRDEEMLQSNLDFLRRACESSLTLIDFPTAFWHQLVGDLTASGLKFGPALRTLIVGGERAIPEQMEGWLEQSRERTQLWNAYGPTEATVCCTKFRVPSQWRAHRQEVPIGRPVQGCQAYLLDYAWQPVSVGVFGHLHIGGGQLARGYLGLPGLTASRFIPDPFGESPGARLYRTGDLACWLADGNLEFRGRFDGQVKLRGFRIETGEIEAQLCRHPFVHEAAVALREDQPGIKRLAAYVVAGSDAPQPLPSDLDSQLRRYLEKSLPAYMVPAAYVVLEAFPLTPSSDKIDRRALPAPQDSRAGLPGAYTAARTPAETRLADIWSQVLGLEQVGVEDNFFELGGDSILSIQVTTRAGRAGLRLTPKQLFDHPTIAELASLAVATDSVAEEQAPQGPVQGELPLTPIQRWFFVEDFAEPQHWNQAVLLEVVDPQWTARRLEEALQALLVHHDALRLRFRRKRQGQWRQFNAGLQRLSFFRLDLSRLGEQQQGQAVESVSGRVQASLGLEGGPLLRSACFEMGDGRPNRLLIVAHHLAVDGVSWRILLEDLLTACRQLAQGDPVALPAKTTSYLDWSWRLQEFLDSGALEEQREYWRTQLGRPSAALPADNPQGSNLESSLGSLVSTLSRQETQALLQEAPQAYGTLINDILLAALDRAFADWLPQGPLMVDLEGHGREELLQGVDLSRTVGWFTSLFPVLLDLNEKEDEEGLLKQVKERLRAIPERGIGFGLLHYGRPDAAVRPHQAQVSFNYLGQFDQVLSEASGLRLSETPCGPHRSPRASRSHLIEIDARITEGRLQVEWKYSLSLHSPSTIQHLADSYIESLTDLIRHCAARAERGYTPSDFPQMDFEQEELDELVSEFAMAIEDDL